MNRVNGCTICTSKKSGGLRTYLRVSLISFEDEVLMGDMITHPMLAGTVKHLSQVRYPLLATPKLDGIRCLKVEGKVLTRSFKPVQNLHIRSKIASLPDGVDGELMAGDFQLTQSSVMSVDGRPDFYYAVFDFASALPYSQRVVQIPDAPFVRRILPELIEDEAQLLSYEEEQLEAGYEGVMLRSPDGPYKMGRSTLREGYLLKFKRFEDSEAVVLDLQEAEENANAIVPDAFGRASRPGGQSMRIPKGTLGSFRVRDLRTGVEFSVGTGKGLTSALRQSIWDNQAAYIGRTIVYTFQPTGTKDRPRFPSFKGFSDEISS